VGRGLRTVAVGPARPVTWWGAVDTLVSAVQRSR
jgi:hypothetical protein